MEYLQDYDDALHRFHPHPSPLPSRERGFCRLFCLVVTPCCGYCLKASMTGDIAALHGCDLYGWVHPTLWIPVYAGMTVGFAKGVI